MCLLKQDHKNQTYSQCVCDVGEKINCLEQIFYLFYRAQTGRDKQSYACRQRNCDYNEDKRVLQCLQKVRIAENIVIVICANAEKSLGSSEAEEGFFGVFRQEGEVYYPVLKEDEENGYIQDLPVLLTKMEKDAVYNALHSPYARYFLEEKDIR